jgi:hypothetical protein
MRGRRHKQVMNEPAAAAAALVYPFCPTEPIHVYVCRDLM